MGYQQQILLASSLRRNHFITLHNGINMKTKEKAQEIYDKIERFTGNCIVCSRKDYGDGCERGCAIRRCNTKNAALLIVDEIIASETFLLNHFDFTREMKAEPNFWNQVKEEIQRL